VRQIERWFARTRSRKLQRSSTANIVDPPGYAQVAQEQDLAQHEGTDIQIREDIHTAPSSSHGLLQSYCARERTCQTKPHHLLLRSRKSWSAAPGHIIGPEAAFFNLRSHSCPPRISSSFMNLSLMALNARLPAATDSRASLQVAVASLQRSSSLAGEPSILWSDPLQLSLTATGILEQSEDVSEDDRKVAVWLENLPDSLESPDQPPYSDLENAIITEEKKDPDPLALDQAHTVRHIQIDNEQYTSQVAVDQHLEIAGIVPSRVIAIEFPDTSHTSTLPISKPPTSKNKRPIKLRAACNCCFAAKVTISPALISSFIHHSNRCIVTVTIRVAEGALRSVCLVYTVNLV